MREAAAEFDPRVTAYAMQRRVPVKGAVKLCVVVLGSLLILGAAWFGFGRLLAGGEPADLSAPPATASLVVAAPSTSAAIQPQQAPTAPAPRKSPKTTKPSPGPPLAGFVFSEDNLCRDNPPGHWLILSRAGTYGWNQAKLRIGYQYEGRYDTDKYHAFGYDISSNQVSLGSLTRLIGLVVSVKNPDGSIQEVSYQPKPNPPNTWSAPLIDPRTGQRAVRVVVCGSQ
jgi:hypothetical protein